MSVAVEEPSPILRTLGFKDRACGVCGWRFFTSAALQEHEAECDARPPSPAQVAAWRQTGLRVAALNNTGRRRCDDCDLTSTPGGLGVHQKATGHSGWSEA